MAQALKVSSVKLLNDFEAIGYGLLALGPADVKHMNPEVKSETGAVKAVIGVSHGLMTPTIIAFGVVHLDSYLVIAQELAPASVRDS